MAITKQDFEYTRAAAADLSAKQYFAVTLNGSAAIALGTTAGERILGILQNDPVSGANGKVKLQGISKAEIGGTIDEFDILTTDSSAKLVTATDPDQIPAAIALEAGVSGDIRSVWLIGAASNVGTALAAATGSVQYAEATVSSAEILALFTTAKELVAAPGAGYVLEFLSSVVILDHGGTDYATQGDLVIASGTTSTTYSDTIAAADLVQASADAIRVVQALSADTALDANESLVLECATGNPTAGDGVIRVKVAYRVHATGL